VLLIKYNNNVMRLPFSKSPKQPKVHWGEAPFIMAPDSNPGIHPSVWGDVDPDSVVGSAKRAYTEEDLGHFALSELNRHILRESGSALLSMSED
jgi:hypothetical protein